MKKAYKLLSIVLAAVIVMTLFAGCGKSASDDSAAQTGAATSSSTTAGKSEPVELTLLDSFLENLTEPYVTTLNAEIDQFIKNHPEIKIVRDRSSSDVLDTKVPTLGAAGELPDLFACRSAWAPNFAIAGEIMKVEDLMKDDQAFMGGFLPGMLDDFQYKGEHYGIPWQATPIYVVYYNMDLLKQAGITKVPATLDELMATIKALNDKGITPMAMGDKGKWQSRLLFSGLSVRTAGVDYLEKLKSGELKFTDPSMLKALQIIEQMSKAGTYNKDATSIDYTQARSLYYNKKVAMYGEMVVFAQVEDQQWPEDVKKSTEMSFFPQMPGEDLSKGVNVPVACDWGIAFNSKLSGDKLKAAQTFAKEVLGDEYNTKLAEAGAIPVRKVQGDYSKIPEAVKRYNEQLAPKLIGGGHIDSRMPGAVLDTVSANLQDILIGQQTAEQAAEKIQAVMDKNLTK